MPGRGSAEADPSHSRAFNLYLFVKERKGGLRAGLALTVVGVIVGEILGSKAGMGSLINHAYGLFRTADYVALVCVTLVVILGSDAVAGLLERRAQRWTE